MKKSEVLELMNEAQICGDPEKVLDYLIEEIGLLPPLIDGWYYKALSEVNMKRSKILDLIEGFLITTDMDDNYSSSNAEDILNLLEEAGMFPPLVEHGLNDYLVYDNCVVCPIDVVSKHCYWENENEKN